MLILLYYSVVRIGNIFGLKAVFSFLFVVVVEF